MQTAKAEPIHNGRGWTVQRNVVRLKQQPYKCMTFEFFLLCYLSVLLKPAYNRSRIQIVWAPF
jgi:hypothetical protein